MLRTHLEHVESDQAFSKLLEENENVMLCCGREGPMCLPVYDAMEKLEDSYPEVAFRDMAFDGQASHNIKSLPQVARFMSLPFTVYFKNGEVVSATSGIQNKKQIKAILDQSFAQPARKVA